MGVALFVAGQLLAPVWTIGLGCVTTLRTSMPEAAINKQGDPLDLEEKIRPPRDVFRANPPANEPISDKVRSETEFRCRIGSRFNCPHVS